MAGGTVAGFARLGALIGKTIEAEPVIERNFIVRPTSELPDLQARRAGFAL
jgi:hypothetical protein